MNVTTQLKLLINLARIDGDVDSKEHRYILNIGKANGATEQEVEQLMTQSHEVIILQNLSDDQRFELIFNLVQLMKIDERLFENEIKYCSQMAARLGYRQLVMLDLMMNVKSIEMEQGEIDSLRKLTAKYLTK
jgi:uncharacterized tellurite resistance protein B-like protein